MSSNSPPSCYGKHWAAHHVECNGGLDPAYTHPERGDHKRDRCSWYSHCAARTAASRLPSERQQLIPPTNLKPQPPALPQTYQSVLQGARTAGQHIQQQVGNIQVRHFPTMPHAPAPMSPPPQQQHATMMAHPSMASMPQMVPMNYPASGMQIPAYLTVPEPIIPGQGLARPFVATMGRSVLKALGHAAANWFDHVPWNPWPYQPPSS